jgi:hypothetical protein
MLHEFIVVRHLVVLVRYLASFKLGFYLSLNESLFEVGMQITRSLAYL